MAQSVCFSFNSFVAMGKVLDEIRDIPAIGVTEKAEFCPQLHVLIVADNQYSQEYYYGYFMGLCTLASSMLDPQPRMLPDNDDDEVEEDAPISTQE